MSQVRQDEIYLGCDEPRWCDGVEVWAELFDGSAVEGAGGRGRRQPGQGGGATVPGQCLLHLQGTGPAQRHRRDRGCERSATSRHSSWQAHRRRDRRPRWRAGRTSRLAELRAWLLATHEVKASLGSMHKMLARLGLDARKESGRAEELDRADIAELRTAWRAGQGRHEPGAAWCSSTDQGRDHMARR